MKLCHHQHSPLHVPCSLCCLFFVDTSTCTCIVCSFLLVSPTHHAFDRIYVWHLELWKVKCDLSRDWTGLQLLKNIKSFSSKCVMTTCDSTTCPPWIIHSAHLTKWCSELWLWTCPWPVLCTYLLLVIYITKYVSVYVLRTLAYPFREATGIEMLNPKSSLLCDQSDCSCTIYPYKGILIDRMLVHVWRKGSVCLLHVYSEGLP